VTCISKIPKTAYQKFTKSKVNPEISRSWKKSQDLGKNPKEWMHRQVRHAGKDKEVKNRLEANFVLVLSI